MYDLRHIADSILLIVELVLLLWLLLMMMQITMAFFTMDFVHICTKIVDIILKKGKDKKKNGRKRIELITFVHLHEC